MNIKNKFYRCAVASIAVLSLIFGIAGTASANTNEAMNEGNTVYLNSSDDDNTLYGTDDAEVIAILNDMTQTFEEYGVEGKYDEIDMSVLEKEVPFRLGMRSWGTFSNCVGVGISRVFGIDVLKRAFTYEVRAALKSRQWRVASAIIYRNLEKYVGKRVASVLIKKIAAKALPGGLPGQIAFQVGKCAVREAW